MANYIKRSLEQGEVIIFTGRLHWSAIFWYRFWSIVLLLSTVAVIIYGYQLPDNRYYYLAGATGLLALVMHIWGRVIRTRTEFAITSSRFIQKVGILNIQMTEIPLFKVETVNYYQNLGQRIIGTGCLELVGSGGTTHQIHSIERPMEVRKVLLSAIKKDAESKQD